MRAALTGNTVETIKKGSSILEILIAVTILSLGIGAVLLLSTANQDLKIDSQTNGEALSKAESMLETARALSRQDFNLVNPIPVTIDGIYSKNLDVQMVDFFTKKVLSNISWNPSGARPQGIQLTTLVTNLDSLGGGNTCNSILEGDWTHPQSKEYEFGRDILYDTSSGFPVTSIQAYKHKLYVTVNNDNGNNPGTFYVLDITNPQNKPVLLSPALFDNNLAVGAGLNAVAVDGSHYAYVANAYGASYTTCNNPGGTNYSCGQLQVIDINNPAAPSMEYSYKIPGVIGHGGQSIGKSIFYKNGIIYLGLAKTQSGPEFNVIDVGGGGIPGASPTNPKIMGSGFSVGSAINSIYVKGDYAYIATPDNEELKVLDIHDPIAGITQVGEFDAPAGGGNNGNGRSVSLVGDHLYLGRTLLNGNEFYILNDVNPESALPVFGSQDIKNLSSNNISVNGIIVRDYLAFLVTSEEFQIYKIDDPMNITLYATPLVLPPGSGNIDGAAADCEGNYIFVGSQGSNDKGYISVITSN